MNLKDNEAELLGYLLDALENDEREALETRLAGDARLQHSMQVLRRSLTPLRSDGDHYAPPLGLADRCCRYVSEQSKVAKAPAEQIGGRTTWRWVDMAVAAGVLFVASMLFFPSVMKSRFDQQVAYCSENLRQLGTGLTQYSQNHGGYFPYVAPEGKLAAAGIFGPTLRQAGLLPDVQSLLCPSSPQAQTDLAMVSLDNLEKAKGPQLEQLKNAMGGSYGYALGYEKNGRYFGQKNQSRPQFALLADSASPRHGGKASMNHDGRGQNVLYEDGRVEFQRTCTASGCQDDIYHNDLGIIGAGQHQNDAVVAPSGARPVRKIHLRFYYLVPSKVQPQQSSPADSQQGVDELIEIDGLD